MQGMASLDGAHVQWALLEPENLQHVQVFGRIDPEQQTKQHGLVIFSSAQLGKGSNPAHQECAGPRTQCNRRCREAFERTNVKSGSRRSKQGRHKQGRSAQASELPGRTPWEGNEPCTAKNAPAQAYRAEAMGVVNFKPHTLEMNDSHRAAQEQGATR